MLVWPNHTVDLLASVRELDMAEATDIDIVCKNGALKTHSLLLAGASPMLRRIFRSVCVELSSDCNVVVVIPWCDTGLVKSALDKLTKSYNEQEDKDILDVFKELGINRGNKTKEEVIDVNEPIVSFKLELESSDGELGVTEILNENSNSLLYSADVVRRKRGRPRQPETLENNVTEEEAPPVKRRRGRPPKSKKKREKSNEVRVTEQEFTSEFLDTRADESTLFVKFEENNIDPVQLFPEHTDTTLEDKISELIVKNAEGLYPCQYENCDYVAGTKSKSRLRQHLMLHLNYRPFHCPECDKTFVERSPAVQHYQVHTGSYSYRCPHCCKQLRSLSAVKQHLLTSHNPGPARFQCGECSYSTNLRGSWSRHQLTHREDRPTYVCQDCGLSYLELRAYQNHLENSCSGVLGQYGFKNNMTPEMREAKEASLKIINVVDVVEGGKKVKTFSCSVCSYSHEQRDQVIRHCYAHTGVRPFHCKHPGCGRQFLEPRGLKDHFVAVHEGVRAYQCDQCEASYSAKASLDSHLKRHMIPLDHFKCDVAGCRYATNNPATLQRHRERMHDPYSKKHLCTVCGKPFYDKRQLAKHELNNHTEPTVQCNYCDKLYHSESSRDKHEMTVHSDETPFQCDECPNAYRHPSSLQKHILAIHRGEEARKFRCEECGKGFITNGKLQSHKRVHTGERNYPCPHCDMRFGDQSAMRRHKYTHEGGKRHECGVCGKTYTQHYDVVRHKANVHGIVASRAKDHANKGKKIKRPPKPSRFTLLVPPDELEETHNSCERLRTESDRRQLAIPGDE